MPDPSTSSGSRRAESRRDWKPDIRARLSQLSIAPSLEAEIVEELTQHLDDRWHEFIARGETPDAAARIARTELNGGRLEALLGTLRQARWHETPRAYGVAMATLVAAALVATVLPARRAASISPVEALRNE